MGGSISFDEWWSRNVVGDNGFDCEEEEARAIWNASHTEALKKAAELVRQDKVNCSHWERDWACPKCIAKAIKAIEAKK
ncbi:MAG: hypothetical protein QME66_08215 [Candidatus Eisenbacteria bacterium]|nr:hypothetical protein [Candidatus Eisenbacteria bacterium]